MADEERFIKRPRVRVLLWLACLGALSAWGCRELADALLARFPGHERPIHIGMVALYALLLTRFSLKPFFKEIGKPLR